MLLSTDLLVELAVGGRVLWLLRAVFLGRGSSVTMVWCVRRATRTTPSVACCRACSTVSNASYTELNLELNEKTKVLTVRFDRESRLNALSEVMGNELHRLIDALQVRVDPSFF